MGSHKCQAEGKKSCLWCPVCAPVINSQGVCCLCSQSTVLAYAELISVKAHRFLPTGLLPDRQTSQPVRLPQCFLPRGSTWLYPCWNIGGSWWHIFPALWMPALCLSVLSGAPRSTLMLSPNCIRALFLTFFFRPLIEMLNHTGPRQTLAINVSHRIPDRVRKINSYSLNLTIQPAILPSHSLLTQNTKS